MRDLNSKISICPICGKKLMKVKYASMDSVFMLCIDSGCRTTVTDGVIDTMGIDRFSRLSEKFNFKNEEGNTFMLLKENLSGPMLQKLSNKVTERDKSMYCIVKADSKEDAINKFQRKFDVIRITDEMVIPITIKEER